MPSQRHQNTEAETATS